MQQWYARLLDAKIFQGMLLVPDWFVGLVDLQRHVCSLQLSSREENSIFQQKRFCCWSVDTERGSHPPEAGGTRRRTSQPTSAPLIFTRLARLEAQWLRHPSSHNEQAFNLWAETGLIFLAGFFHRPRSLRTAYR